MIRHLAAPAVVALLVAAPGAARPAPPEPLRRLDASAPILCATDDRGRHVRLQCAGPGVEPGTCLVAPACLEGLVAPTAACTWLERTGACQWSSDPTTSWDELVAGRRLVPAIADAADGWWRDEDGRVFQIAFDMNQRMWLGARWLGAFGPHRPSELGGLVVDTGFRVDVLHGDLAARTRYRFLEADLGLAPFGVRARLLMVDTSTDGDEPFMRITTFVGEPTRHDIYLTAGWWGELAALEHAPRGSRDDTLFRFVGLGMTWDLWHDATMESFVRLRGGVGLDEIVRAQDDPRIALTPLVALEVDAVLDRAGFHRLTFASTYERSFFDRGDDDGGELASHARFSNELAYELIALAINDQPVTVRVGAQGGFRDDLSDPSRRGWEVALTAGLRVSLWAPAPDEGERAQAEARRRERDR